MAPNQAILANCHSDQQESSLQRPCSSWSGEEKTGMGEGRARQPLQPGLANTEEIGLQPSSVSGRGSHLLP